MTLKRTPLRPSQKAIPRYTRLPRSHKPIRARKADPERRRFAKHRCKPFTDSLKGLPCCVSGESVWRYAIVDPAHIKTRGSGGDDLYNTLPLVRHLHEEQHRIGWPRFEKKYGIDRVALAHAYTERWLATEDGQAWQAEQGKP